MKPSPFNYLNVTTIENALDALSSNDNASLIAGGQSLVPMMNFRLAQPDLIIDISNINELKNVTEEKDYVEIGSLLTHTNAINSICLKKILSCYFKCIKKCCTSYNKESRYRWRKYSKC